MNNLIDYCIRNINKVPRKHVEPVLVQICEREHSQCNLECPVFEINGGIPWDADKKNCVCFKNGFAMYEFILARQETAKMRRAGDVPASPFDKPVAPVFEDEVLKKYEREIKVLKRAVRALAKLNLHQRIGIPEVPEWVFYDLDCVKKWYGKDLTKIV